MAEELNEVQKAGLDKIRKILSKITHTGGATQASEGEMETAMKMARLMMKKFNIDEGLFEKLVEGSEGEKQALYDTIMADVAFSRKDFKGTEFFRRIGDAVALVCDVGFRMPTRNMPNPQVRRGETHSNRQCIEFYGLPRDVAVAKALYQELIATMHAMARMSFGTGWTGKHNGYAFGLADRLYYRALAQKDAEGRSSSGDDAKSSAIVVSKKALLDRYRYEHFHGPKPEWMKTQAERDAEAKRQQEYEEAYKRRQAEHERKMKEDPKYRRDYEREQAKWAKRKGPRVRHVDAEGYNKGYEDAENISLGTDQIHGSQTSQNHLP